MDTMSITTQRLRIVPADASLAQDLARFYGDNRERLRQWEPTRDLCFYSLENTRGRLIERELEIARGTGFFFILLEAESGRIVGECNFTNVVRGPFQACHLGFSLDGGREGSGLMQEALSACIAYLFDTVQLHRIMANYQPKNLRSERLLERLGFAREGYAKSYLKINGVWEDHVLCSLIRPDD